jgi:hypothetical protein
VKELKIDLIGPGFIRDVAGTYDQAIGFEVVFVTKSNAPQQSGEKEAQ